MEENLLLEIDDVGAQAGKESLQHGTRRTGNNKSLFSLPTSSYRLRLNRMLDYP
jgi:hypothetical protein